MIKQTEKVKRSPAGGRIKPASEKVTAEERYCMIQEHAYLQAEKDNFSGDPCRYWVTAEAAVDARLAREK
ncbi:DUF2934 domain-containing protein [candidate division NPL-UPA2 bacterium Unc8]|uniref:DUF2934 domain-containing protein n=2 Tax=Bacteria TaxID=2 RepID=A0A9E2F1D5_PSYF1|nr:hypothetical protein [Bacillota bacterium]MBT9145334.1 hypothetical protein [Candidatus Psychracetigena formicireducens]RIH99618.1 MAG: DUF2934 domain-containing protein [candidate division NPL-UPA2 bacterium Unc8]